MKHRSGFVNIIGNPNVGKSTLMNALVGEKISIITSKMQTTRHRILGIVNGEDFQVVVSDTPGIIKPSYQLQKVMMRSVSSALTDADLILYITDVVEQFDKHSETIEKLKKIKIPVFVVINKIDMVSEKESRALVDTWHEIFPKAEIFLISALHNLHVNILFERILALLPEGPEYFPKDQLTDRTERFIVSEIIREKILNLYRKEIPYSVEIEVESFKEGDDMIRIRSVIHVMRETQKGILIGREGRALKKVGTYARQDMESFFGKKVFLELMVKTTPDWRDNEHLLKSFGYH
jgi:GTP-binding protein Era